MLDRLDDALEPLARVIGGKAQWDEMKENAHLPRASRRRRAGAGRRCSRDAHEAVPGARIHLAGHSAGSILLGSLVERLASGGAKNVPIKTCTLWAPACTMDVFSNQYLPAIESGAIEHFALFTLTDKAERDDNARTSTTSRCSTWCRTRSNRGCRRRPFSASGMASRFSEWPKFISRLPAAQRNWDRVQSPNGNPTSSLESSTAKAHGAFDDDAATLASTLGRIAGVAKVKDTGFAHHPSAAANRAIRAPLNAMD